MDPRWGWFSMVDRLANGDITKHDQIYDINYIYCLTNLLYMVEKDDYIEKVNYVNTQKNKVKYK